MAILVERAINGGVQIQHKFENGYGASVIKNKFSYGGERGLWEMAVIKFTDGDNWELDYSTEITNDVLGDLTDEDVAEKLDEIKKLKGK